VKSAIPFILNAATTPNKIVDLLTATRPSTLYLCAASTWVDGCEADEESTVHVNAVAPALVAQVAATFGVKVVLFSTDYVFDGRCGPYLETDDVCPVNVYGRSKLKAEELISDVCPSALIIRTTVVYGPEDAGKNFAYHICTRLSQGETVQCITDQFTTPTYNRDLAEMAVRLVNEDCSGIYNCVGDERMNRHEFAVILAEELGYDTRLVESITTCDLESRAQREGRLMAKRGLNLGLLMSKTSSQLPHFQARSVRESIKHWLAHPRGKLLQ